MRHRIVYRCIIPITYPLQKAATATPCGTPSLYKPSNLSHRPSYINFAAILSTHVKSHPRKTQLSSAPSPLPPLTSAVRRHGPAEVGAPAQLSAKSSPPLQAGGKRPAISTPMAAFHRRPSSKPAVRKTMAATADRRLSSPSHFKRIGSCTHTYTVRSLL